MTDFSNERPPRGTMPSGYNKEMSNINQDDPILDNNSTYISRLSCDSCGNRVNTRIRVGTSPKDHKKKSVCQICGCPMKKKFLGVF